MSVSKRLSVGALLLFVLSASITPCAAQVGRSGAATGSVSRTTYSYDRFGNLLGAKVMIWTSTGGQWVFALPRRFLELPVRRQLAILDQRFRLAGDRQQVGLVLQSIQQSRSEQQLQQTLDQINRLNQQMDQQRRLQQQLDQINRLNQQRPWQPPPSSLPSRLR